jgi:integrase
MRTKIRRRQTRSGVRWYVSTVDDAGKEEAHGGYPTKQKAKAVAAAKSADADLGRYVSPAKVTLSDYLRLEWLPARENADLSASTKDTDRTVIEAWILPYIGQIPLQQLKARDLDTLYETLRKRGGRGGRPLRGKSVRNVHVTLSKALGDAVRRGHIAVNPVLAVDPPARDDSVDRRAWTRDEAARFLPIASKDRLGAVWRLALATGLRRGEVLGLTWDDVDLERLVVAVRRQVLVRPRSVLNTPRIYVRATTKTRRVRLVRFDEATAAALRRWKTAQAMEHLSFGGAWKTDGGLGQEAPWIVTEPDGAVVNPETLLGRWRRLVKTAKVTPIPLHGARHSYATLALEAGVRLDIVSAQLGHSNVATTATIYAHISEVAAC